MNKYLFGIVIIILFSNYTLASEFETYNPNKNNAKKINKDIQYIANKRLRFIFGVDYISDQYFNSPAGVGWDRNNYINITHSSPALGFHFGGSLYISDSISLNLKLYIMKKDLIFIILDKNKKEYSNTVLRAQAREIDTGADLYAYWDIHQGKDLIWGLSGGIGYEQSFFIERFFEKHTFSRKSEYQVLNGKESNLTNRYLIYGAGIYIDTQNFRFDIKTTVSKAPVIHHPIEDYNNYSHPSAVGCVVSISMFY